MIIIRIVVILAVARLMRYPARLFGLPVVIGEMLAGFVLGPTVFGFLFPQPFHLAFPVAAIRQISSIGTLIVTAYCFVIGLEFDPAHLRGRFSGLVVSALSSALIPAAFGYLSARLVASRLSLSLPPSFNLAMGLCFSVTAFPILLRMVEESGLDSHPVGIFSIGISAILELLIWSALPVLLALATSGNSAHAGAVLASAAGFLLVWFTLVKWSLRWFWMKVRPDGLASLLALAIVGIGSAWLTDRLGIHANFGAFIGGFVIPRQVSFTFGNKLKPYCVFFLPVFFAAAGLKTILNLNSGSGIFLLAGFALLAYILKAGGTSLAARLTGSLSWSDSLTAGHLMCAKGAIGFAVIEICLSAGMLDSNSFSILAFVILANTIMSAWGLRLHQKLKNKEKIHDEKNHFISAGLYLSRPSGGLCARSESRSGEPPTNRAGPGGFAYSRSDGDHSSPNFNHGGSHP